MGYDVRFLPDDRSWHGEEPVPLRLAAASCDILIEQPCGSRATCGRCRVRVFGGGPDPQPVEISVLGEPAVEDGWRLGCRLLVDRNATIEVPPVSRVVAHKTFGDAVSVVDPVGEQGYGIALDLGSTTLAAAVVALSTGEVAGIASALNPQVTLGADIMSRIAFARRDPGGEAELHRVLVLAVDHLVGDALAAAGLARDAVVETAVVGNPTMLHTFQELPVAPLGVAPFQGGQYSGWHGAAADLGLELPGRVYLLPGIRGHVGADTVAGILAAGLDRPGGPRLFMDLGTNTELVLATPDGLWCASAASGPAFEGASIRHGMRAIPGAIDQVWIAPDGRLLVRTVADEPIGICGSGVVDAVAELLGAGVIEPSGRMRSAEEVESHATALAGRVIEVEGVRAVRLTDGLHPVLLTADDVRQIQLVKGSIGAATRLLLREAGCGAADLEEVVLAGAFGSYVRGASARALGLIPAVDPRRVRFAGNAAGAGARWALVDRWARAQAEGVARDARSVELAGRPDYEEAFVEMLRFPGEEEV